MMTMAGRMFRYYKEDFGQIPVRVVHMDLIFDVYDDHTKVTSDLHAESREAPLTELALNAKNLEIIEVSSPGREITYDYDTSNNMLIIRFKEPMPPHTQFVVHTETLCRPTKNILEGIYYDETPAGAPPQQITQCQQWGFQRLVPCIDDMTAKCTYTTTIIADARYTNIMTNGNISVARRPIGSGRVQVTYENMVTPMAPYLFFLGCGTYATFVRECEYANGSRCSLELLVSPTSDPLIANQALDVLLDAVLWVHLFTGPERYGKTEVRDRLYQLISEMNRIKKTDVSSERLNDIRRELKGLTEQIVPGYQYTGAVYREIAMQNSDFGGMENVGNTTITANRIMPYPNMTDPSFEYMTKVKVHEYYHNLNGSEVTGWSPFEIWLNEAVTVHIENQYYAFHFGNDYARLAYVLALLTPGSGTLDLDSGAASLPIEPDGFNDPNELITDITYMKAPEFVRMIETLMGKEAFVKGLDLYHRRYRHGNATREQWIQAMEEVSGQHFAAMAEEWLKQTGFPTLHVRASYDDERRTMTLVLRQTANGQKKHWTFPIRIALVTASGRDLAEVLHRFEKEEETIEISSPERPAFLSINRGHSFYGRVSYEASVKELYLQVEHDSDIINRYLAFTKLVDREKMRMLEDPEASPDRELIDLFYRLLSDNDLMLRAGGQFLTVFESSPDRRYAHHYQELHDVRERLFRSIAARHKEDLVRLYHQWNIPAIAQDDVWDRVPGNKTRQVKNTALAVLSRLDTPEIHQLIRRQLETSANASDRQVAFSLYMDSSAADRIDVLADYEKESRKSLVGWENFLRIIAENSSPDALELISRAERSDAFRIEQANDQRALYLRFALNRKKSLQTEEGRAFLKKTMLMLASINEHTTVGMLRVFGALDEMREEDQVPLARMLEELLQELDQEGMPSVYNTIRRILTGAPNAVARSHAVR